MVTPPGAGPAGTVRETPFTVFNEKGDPLRGDLRYTAGGRPAPLILVCHGFTAHKDWGPFPFIGNALAAAGFASAVFNFSHNGMGPGFRRFTELEKFSRNTIGREVGDVRALVDAAAAGVLGKGILDPSRIGILGHSRGGGVALLAASRDERIRAVVGWGSVATFRRFTPHQREIWERDGFLPVTVRGMRTRLRYGIEILRDLDANADAYDLHRAAAALRVPLLLVHGEADVSVKPEEARSLVDAAGGTLRQMVVIGGTGHAFGAGHPWRASNPALDRAIAETAAWFHSYL
ncbi:MAG TPA: alpha/beta fold hydrolase [Bacteroidota bacterium]|nr:alpha/beta fold hydrolase [Bacteroidota bacterium]